jgi:GH43 family beta-xylosidase
MAIKNDAPFSVNESELNRIIEHARGNRFDCVEISSADIAAERDAASRIVKFLNRAEVKRKISSYDIDEISGKIYIYFEI